MVAARRTGTKEGLRGEEHAETRGGGSTRGGTGARIRHLVVVMVVLVWDN